LDKINAHILYGRDKDSFRVNLPNPLSVCWQVNLNCNLRCRFCISESKPNGYEGLPTASAIDVIARLRDAGIQRIDFSGGDPLLRQDLPELLTYAKERGINSVVTTNGALIDDNHIDLFKETVSAVQISIDGPKDFHNSFRGANVYDRTVSNAKKLVESGCNVRISTVLFKSNLDYWDYLLGLSSELGAFSHFFNLLAPIGRGASLRKEMIDHDQIRELRRKIIRYNSAQNHDRHVRILDYKDFNGSLVVISARGEILGQSDINQPAKKLGHILTDDIKTVFSGPAYDHYYHLIRYTKKY
jgi:MoaA/NifB/PqqE/SkfB family radical SAM enzyme